MPKPGDREPNSPLVTQDSGIATQFVWEVTILLVGLLTGFFWHVYYDLEPSNLVHIIIGLVVIIVCLGRYITLVKRR